MNQQVPLYFDPNMYQTKSLAFDRGRDLNNRLLMVQYFTGSAIRRALIQILNVHAV